MGKLSGWLGTLCISILCIWLLFPIPRQVYACNCDVPANATEALERADAVFTGKVKDVKQLYRFPFIHKLLSGKSDLYLKEIGVEAIVEVGMRWKGNPPQVVIVSTPITSCQFDFEEGESYLFYTSTWPEPDNYTVTNCGRSGRESERAVDIKELGEGGMLIGGTIRINPIPWVIVGVLASTAILLITVNIPRKKREKK